MQKERISVEVESRTKNTTSTLSISKEFLGDSDRVVIVDDFLGSGGALQAISSLVSETGAQILGACFVIEKTYEGAREKLHKLDYPIFSLVKATIANELLSFY